jgi:hypothetical protein
VRELDAVGGIAIAADQIATSDEPTTVREIDDEPLAEHENVFYGSADACI